MDQEAAEWWELAERERRRFESHQPPKSKRRKHRHRKRESDFVEVVRQREIAALVREQNYDRKNQYYQRWAGDMRRHDYKTYIVSAEWKTFRDKIIADRGYRCEKCGTHKGILQVHHLHYRNLGCEKPEDVQALCSICHRKIHEAPPWD